LLCFSNCPLFVVLPACMNAQGFRRSARMQTMQALQICRLLLIISQTGTGKASGYLCIRFIATFLLPRVDDMCAALSTPPLSVCSSSSPESTTQAQGVKCSAKGSTSIAEANSSLSSGSGTAFQKKKKKKEKKMQWRAERSFGQTVGGCVCVQGVR